jgi:hypothetical protein
MARELCGSAEAGSTALAVPLAPTAAALVATDTPPASSARTTELLNKSMAARVLKMHMGVSQQTAKVVARLNFFQNNSLFLGFIENFQTQDWVA